uniref:Uncharacterized protein n=1 Tax=Dicentrarchus labrax TaxID=13489 RepID=A0A8P4GDF5_DICLA
GLIYYRPRPCHLSGREMKGEVEKETKGKKQGNKGLADSSVNSPRMAALIDS